MVMVVQQFFRPAAAGGHRMGGMQTAPDTRPLTETLRDASDDARRPRYVEHGRQTTAAVGAVRQGRHANRAGECRARQQRIDNGVLTPLHPTEASQRAVCDDDVPRPQSELVESRLNHSLRNRRPTIG